MIPEAPKISAVLIVRNEAEQLKTTLPLLDFCEEIVVVDSGSTDGTRAVAEGFGCLVVEREFTGFGSQKAYAVSLARNDWVLNLDADEKVSPELKGEILRFLGSASVEVTGFEIRRTLVFLGRRFRFGREANDFVLRLFRKSAGTFDSAEVHEKVRLTRGRVERGSAPLLHESYPSLESYVAKMNRYTSLGARTQGGSRWGIFMAALFPFKFVHFYIAHLNLLNGWAGFCWSALSSFAYFVKQLKRAELKTATPPAKLGA
jgi:glycosyltransferase involved in cell wall biosynthesis